MIYVSDLQVKLFEAEAELNCYSHSSIDSIELLHFMVLVKWLNVRIKILL